MFSWLFSNIKGDEVEPVLNWVVAQAKETFPTYFEEATTQLRQRQLKFEAIAIYLAMAIRLLKDQPEKAQEVHDAMFDRFEVSMREQGVADVRVGTEVRKLASAFHGRYEHYVSAFEESSQEKLLETWERNMVCEGVDAQSAAQTVMQVWQNIKSTPEKMAA